MQVSLLEYKEPRIELPDEFEQVRKLNLFTYDEIRKLIKKRKEFENKIERHNKCKDDYVKYIEFEVSLLRDLAVRRRKSNNKKKKDVIDFVFAKHVAYLYQQAIYKFPDDVKLWLAYIKFCKTSFFTDRVSQILGRMLKVHGDQPTLWHMAARWELDEIKSPETALQFLYRGLHFHPKNQLLHAEAFRLTLMTSKNKQPPETKEAEVMYDSAKKIDDIEFFISLLKIAEEYPFSAPLQHKIVKFLKEQYPKEELMWHTIAQREIEGHNFDVGEKIPGTSTETITSRAKLLLCVSVYEIAVQQLKTEKMWDTYIEAMLEVNQNLSVLGKMKKGILDKALQGAHSAGFMSERKYLQWLKLLHSTTEKNEKMLEILEVSTNKYPNSTELWKERLGYFVKIDDEESAEAVFEEAKSVMDSGLQLPLWDMMLLYHQSKPNYTAVQNIYQESLKQPTEISEPMKPGFIEWLALSKGIGSARKAYLATAENPPFCLELHTKMAFFESMQITLNIKMWRRCLEMATEQFGEDNTDVWINLIKFELNNGEPKQAIDVYKLAIETLKSDLKEIFESEHRRFRNGMI